MAIKRISELPQAVSVGGSELIPFVQDGETRQTTLQTIANQMLRGEKGDPGIPGPPGEKGDPGIPGPPGEGVDVGDLSGFPGGTTTFLRADGTFAAPPGGGGGMTNPMTTIGDQIVGGSSGTPTRVGAGTDGHVWTMVSGAPAWAAAPGGGGGGMSNPMTTAGDIIYGGASGVPTRLAAGANGYLLGVMSGNPTYRALGTGGWGIALLASPALTGTPTAPTANAGTSTTQIATCAFVNSLSVQEVTSSATVTPTFTNDAVNISAQAVNLTLANPSGTAVNRWGIVITIKDNGTSRMITFGSKYKTVDGVTLPAATTVGKTTILPMVYDSASDKWWVTGAMTV